MYGTCYLTFPFLLTGIKLGKTRQAQTDRQTLRKNASRVDYDYAVGGHVLVQEDGILCKSAAKYTDPFRISTVHTNIIIRIQKGALSKRLNIIIVKP